MCNCFICSVVCVLILIHHVYALVKRAYAFTCKTQNSLGNINTRGKIKTTTTTKKNVNVNVKPKDEQFYLQMTKLFVVLDDVPLLHLVLNWNKENRIKSVSVLLIEFKEELNIRSVMYIFSQRHLHQRCLELNDMMNSRGNEKKNTHTTFSLVACVHLFFFVRFHFAYILDFLALYRIIPAHLRLFSPEKLYKQYWIINFMHLL